eukprot:TRINITY_DN2653_c0_g2_i1.p1 TRINITY_DN2653_c0_g2~~TRINITY_DN2653_c0_g2_i1.p1  ORF type:complete len:549 (+),score=97.85 TRINITY_DN2653_c0_g2_i1:1169-2815(+)
MTKTSIVVWLTVSLVLVMFCGFAFFSVSSLNTSDDTQDTQKKRTLEDVLNIFSRTLTAKEKCDEERDEALKKLAESSQSIIAERANIQKELTKLETTREMVHREQEQMAKEAKAGVQTKSTSTDGTSAFGSTLLPVSKQTEKYDVNPNPECWNQDCHVFPNNLLAYTSCAIAEATLWNKMGVESMERYFEGDTDDLPNFNERYFQEAFWYFSNATEVDITCHRAKVNLALLNMAMGKNEDAVKLMDDAINYEKSARYYAIRSYLNELVGNDQARRDDLERALELDKFIAERRYFGILLANTTFPHVYRYFPIIISYAHDIELKFVTKALLYIEFSRVSIGNYAILGPHAQDNFVDNSWTVVRGMLPPYIQRAYQSCYQEEINTGRLQLENAYNGQSLRYYAFNDRCGRIIHFQLVDLVRRNVAHNALPTYLYFGGYINSSQLVPHTDRPPCEFTISLNLGQNPVDEPWPLGLGYKPVIERDDSWQGQNHMPWPPEDERRWAILYPGDGLLFMGRHLVHFRESALSGEDRWVNHVFLHYAQENYKGTFE